MDKLCLQGVIATLKDGYGFIQCADREARMFFHFSEFMDPEYIPEDKAEVQFTVLPVSGFVLLFRLLCKWFFHCSVHLATSDFLTVVVTVVPILFCLLCQHNDCTRTFFKLMWCLWGSKGGSRRPVRNPLIPDKYKAVCIQLLLELY